ncbi:rRNA methyltransferase 1, mitochondrial [Trichonephila clavipes]|nr:rRNA methyltransferase 1, mitochondrial [Trichonephila clavipes]
MYNPALQGAQSWTDAKMKQKSLPILYKGEILYGIHPVYLALLEKKRQLFQLFIKVQEENCLKTEKNERLSKIDNIARTLEIPVHYVDSKVMNYLAPGAVHQCTTIHKKIVGYSYKPLLTLEIVFSFHFILGVCLDAGAVPKLEWQDIECKINEEASSDLPLWLVLNEIVDPMNVGAIIRSAKYFGINNLFMMKGSSCKLSPTVSKASSGALEVINIYQIEKLEHFLQVKKTQGWNIVSTHAYCENECKTSKEIKDVSDLRISKPTILILGNEGKGIPFEILRLCDTFVSIYPTQNLHPGIDSLNVSVAADNLVALHFKYDQARSRFVEWAQNEIAAVPDFHKRILFSDEAHFWLNGYVNKQNCRIWSEANPQVYVETPLHPEKLTVGCALWAGGIIGLYFFKNDEGHNVTVNGDRYRAMITNFFIPELNNHDLQELWFQQDGATCHTARATIDLLKDTFGDSLISRFGPVDWPPKSCDLTPLDYFLWGYVKSLVYADKPQTLDHLEDNICRVIADIRPQMLEKVIENWTSRLDYIRASRGSPMLEIIFKM